MFLELCSFSEVTAHVLRQTLVSFDSLSCIPFFEILSNSLVHTIPELGSVSKGKEKFHPYKKWRQHYRLNEIVEECRCSTLEDAMSYKLCEPGEDM